MKIRIGQGFDLHRLAKGLPLMLGGVKIDSLIGSVGHSDGDVVLHALIDAILGALGEGDIGDWFPPSNPGLKGAESSSLLQTVLTQLDAWQIEQVDITLLLEAPKLGQQKQVIRKYLSQQLGLPIESIGLKAKTMEGLGEIGRGEALAAWVSVLLIQ